jgi:hypothetical protein
LNALVQALFIAVHGINFASAFLAKIAKIFGIFGCRKRLPVQYEMGLLCFYAPIRRADIQGAGGIRLCCKNKAEQ